MITYEEALSLSLTNAVRPEPKAIPLSEAFARVLAQDLVSPFPQPRFDNSAVDGYALANGTPGPTWSVVRTIAAGDPPGTALQPGECARIFTGAPTPPNTFAVVMQEDTVTRSGNIEVAIALKEGQHIRRAGEEVQTGEIALAEGTPLFAAGLGSVANLGLSEVAVVPAPRVGIVVTGAELVAIGEELDPAQIYESNSVVVTSALKALGLNPEFIRTTGDDPEASAQVLNEALEQCDLLITTGGVSVGDRDVVRQTLHSLGVQEIFWKVAIKPGKPVFMGRMGRKVVFGLPGNPLSVLATFHLLVQPWIRASMGFSSPSPRRHKAKLASALTHKPGRNEFVPGSTTLVGGDLWVSPIPGQGSHMLSGMATANALIDVPTELEFLDEGQLVWVLPL